MYVCMYVCMYVRSSFIVYCFSKRLANYVLPFAVCCADKMINMYRLALADWQNADGEGKHQ